ncbi:hypothetical protein COCON_G00025220 [Conger conger]|uniref:Uncharacterized protein n=1 Tax=Conger conger TaxID=82655 RepID=A0A9Q1DXK7_CONCO|nr:hypothetical protein COCON_G00025220 [Conger conger]
MAPHETQNQEWWMRNSQNNRGLKQIDKDYRQELAKSSQICSPASVLPWRRGAFQLQWKTVGWENREGQATPSLQSTRVILCPHAAHLSVAEAEKCICVIFPHGGGVEVLCTVEIRRGRRGAGGPGGKEKDFLHNHLRRTD